MKFKIVKPLHDSYELILTYEDNIKQECAFKKWYNTINTSKPDRYDENYNEIFSDNINSLNRARNKVLDYALNNNFDYFVTFTFDIEKIDRYNYDIVRKKLLKSINNYNRKFGVKLKYVIVPELHKLKDGEKKAAIHFHGLMSGFEDLKYLTYVRGKGYKLYRSMYFFDKFGANQMVKIQDYNKFVSYYIAKYISKDNERIFRNRYFVSQGLDSSYVIKEGVINIHDLNKVIDFGIIPTYQNDFVTKFKFDNIDLINYLVTLSF